MPEVWEATDTSQNPGILFCVGCSWRPLQPKGLNAFSALYSLQPFQGPAQSAGPWQPFKSRKAEKASIILVPSLRLSSSSRIERLPPESNPPTRPLQCTHPGEQRSFVFGGTLRPNSRMATGSLCYGAGCSLTHHGCNHHHHQLPPPHYNACALELPDWITKSLPPRECEVIS
uniref:Uncharacterized protein n=1 Tax=Sphaerodactylus townsendi TaxID=933632 RepID=A0ACB8EL56_9SAUR